MPNSDFNKSALLGPTPFKYEIEVFRLYNDYFFMNYEGNNSNSNKQS